MLDDHGDEKDDFYVEHHYVTITELPSGIKTHTIRPLPSAVANCHIERWAMGEGPISSLNKLFNK